MTDYSTILSHSFFIKLILPFLLVFTLIFAILEKSGVLGEDNKQINAIIALVFALVLVAFEPANQLIINLIPIFAVIAVVGLIFMMLYGFAGGGMDEGWIKIVFGSLVGIALIVSLLVFTGAWNFLISSLGSSQGMQIASNIFFVVVIIAAIVLVMGGGGQ